MPKFRNEGGPLLVVELGRVVEKGEEFSGSDALGDAHGVVRVDEPKSKPAKGEKDED